MIWTGGEILVATYRYIHSAGPPRLFCAVLILAFSAGESLRSDPTGNKLNSTCVEPVGTVDLSLLVPIVPALHPLSPFPSPPGRRWTCIELNTKPKSPVVSTPFRKIQEGKGQ